VFGDDKVATHPCKLDGPRERPHVVQEARVVEQMRGRATVHKHVGAVVNAGNADIETELGFFDGRVEVVVTDERVGVRGAVGGALGVAFVESVENQLGEDKIGIKFGGAVGSDS